MTTRKRGFSNTKVLIATVGAAMFGIAPVFAQEAASFEQLQVLIRPGDTVVVTDSTGHRTKGKIQSLTPSKLKIADKTNLREFTPNETLRISQRRSDSLANGAGTGAAIGGGFGAVTMLAGCTESTGCNAGILASVIGISAGIGAGVGVLVDALITHRQTIYEGPKTSPLGHLDMKPILTKDKKGAAVAFSF